MRCFLELVKFFILGIILTACANQGMDRKQASETDDQTYVKLQKMHDRQIDRFIWK